MFDEIRRRIHHAGDQHLVLRNLARAVAEDGPFMAVAGIGGLEQDEGRGHLH